MICEQCGTGVPAGPGFCPECGSAVKAPGPEATFKFACPHCRQRIRVPRSWGGNRGHCPACRCSLVIPAPEPELALHPAPPAACAIAEQVPITRVELNAAWVTLTQRPPTNRLSRFRE